jgi:hypothetical protein
MNSRLQTTLAGLWTVDCGLWTVDCGLWTAAYGPRAVSTLQIHSGVAYFSRARLRMRSI